jgi:hypothetical protein
MWEYSVLHEHDENWVVVQVGEGIANSYIEAKFETEINDGWKIRADEAFGSSNERKKISRNPFQDTIWWIYQEKPWDEENPVFEIQTDPKKLESWDSSNKNYHSIIHLFGAEVKSAKWVTNNLTPVLFKAKTVTRVLSKAGAEGWELVGNVPGGKHRMLRREL